MRTLFKVLGAAGIVTGILALRKRSESKKESAVSEKRELKSSADAKKRLVKADSGEFLREAQKVVNSSVSKLKVFKSKVNKLDEKAQKAFNKKIDQLIDSRDKVNAKISEFKRVADEKKDSIKSEILKLNHGLSLSLVRLEKELK